ncbi:universal stress protein [Nocardiopsis sp. YSL2]|uniref:universal stress protein n=1 Tax=Nocardiopsis sp. YSL2 TaxID=2939492 RepID=UPI0026F45567|nr:universal stress protein [Nocardiopsis sp. YSL2]
MSEGSARPVVAAVDGTEQSLRALDWAADEAGIRDRRLRVVYAFEWPMRRVAAMGAPGFDPDEFARRILEDARQRVEARTPEVAIDPVYVDGDPVPVLLTQAKEAEVLVLGSRGLGTLGSAVLGSTGMQLATAAACPVVVVPSRTTGPRSGRVAVAVDGSPASLAALDWAFTVAEDHDATLSAIMVCDDPPSLFTGPLAKAAYRGPSETERAAAQEIAHQLLADATAPGRELHPQVRVTEVVAAGHAAQELIGEAEEADLLVVGSRGHGGFAGMLLGSVSHAVLTHSTRPVAVVRAPRD